eukprot:347452-Chlamydomonas_euryale.AAC.1
MAAAASAAVALSAAEVSAAMAAAASAAAAAAAAEVSASESAVRVTCCGGRAPLRRPPLLRCAAAPSAWTRLHAAARPAAAPPPSPRMPAVSGTPPPAAWECRWGLSRTAAAWRPRVRGCSCWRRQRCMRGRWPHVGLAAPVMAAAAAPAMAAAPLTPTAAAMAAAAAARLAGTFMPTLPGWRARWRQRLRDTLAQATPMLWWESRVRSLWGERHSQFKQGKKTSESHACVMEGACVSTRGGTCSVCKSHEQSKTPACNGSRSPKGACSPPLPCVAAG